MSISSHHNCYSLDNTFIIAEALPKEVRREGMFAYTQGLNSQLCRVPPHPTNFGQTRSYVGVAYTNIGMLLCFSKRCNKFKIKDIKN